MLVWEEGWGLKAPNRRQGQEGEWASRSLGRQPPQQRELPGRRWSVKRKKAMLSQSESPGLRQREQDGTEAHGVDVGVVDRAVEVLVAVDVNLHRRKCQMNLLS